MFEFVSVIIALGGSSIAGWYDLKTTEIPDWASVGMIVSGIVIALTRSAIQWNYLYIFRSAAVGAAFFSFGFLMYLGRQWGGGDVKVFAGVGALIPAFPSLAPVEAAFPFPFVYLVNLFLIGALYITVYAFGFAFFQESLISEFVEKVKERRREIIFVSCLPLLLFAGLAWILGPQRYLYNLIFLVPGIVGLMLLFRFLRVVERKGFKHKISTQELEVGDMLAEPLEEIEEDHEPRENLKEISSFFVPFLALSLVMFFVGFTGNLYFYCALFSGTVMGILTLLHAVPRLRGEALQNSSDRIRGLETKEVEKLKEERSEVEIREGVRFAPVFPIAVLASLFLGNLLLLIL